MNLPIAIIGGGQAGLAIARCFQRQGIEPVVLDAADRTGEAWRHRYDSLRLFTPAQYDGLPDLPFPAPRDTHPSKDDVAAYLETYARHFDIDVRHGCRVEALRRPSPGRPFELDVTGGAVAADRVIVATGALQHPHRPALPGEPPAEVVQLHSSAYRNPADITGRRVLIVGAGNSGAQIAEDLAGRFDVTISFESLPRRLPQRVLGRDIFWWLDHLGVLDRTSDPTHGPAAAVGAIPLIGSSLPRLLRSGTVRRAARIERADSAGFHDAASTIHLPDTVIWATGFRNDFSWIDIPGALDDQGQPIHHRGLSTTTSGLGFIGLPGLHTKGSAFLGFVGRDAAHLAEALATP